jgi:hypothetical protein
VPRDLQGVKASEDELSGLSLTESTNLQLMKTGSSIFLLGVYSPFHNVPGTRSLPRPPTPLRHAVWRVRQRSEIQIWTLNASMRYFDYDFGLAIHERFKAKRT